MPAAPAAAAAARAPTQGNGASQKKNTSQNRNANTNNRPAATGMPTALVQGQLDAEGNDTYLGPNTSALLLRMDARLGFVVENLTLHRQQVNLLAGEVRNALGQLSVLQKIQDKLAELEEAIDRLAAQEEEQEEEADASSESASASAAEDSDGNGEEL
jgi:hypothetical protein